MANLSSYLRQKGYRPDVANNNLKYVKALTNLIGQDRAEDYFQWFDQQKELHGFIDEKVVWDYVGNNPAMMKMLISTQLNLSMHCVEIFIEVLKNNPSIPNNILELGAADGWAAAYLKERFKISGEVAVVDRNPFWGKAEDYIQTHHQNYFDLNIGKKYDLIIGALPAPLLACKELFECINRHVHENSLILLGIRVGGDDELEQFYEMAAKNSFCIDFNRSEKTPSHPNSERIPVFVMKTTGEASYSHQIRLIRKLNYGLEEPKRVVGAEAKFLFRVIESGELVKHDHQDFSNATSTLKLIKFNELLFLVWYNSMGDIIIEYPMLQSDIKGINVQDYNSAITSDFFLPGL